MAPRSNGFQGPIGEWALLAWAGQLASIGVFAALLGCAAQPSAVLGAMLGVYLPVLCLAVACWLYCQCVDPAQAGGWAVPCMRASQAIDRYCSVCRKTVPGLDHHCKWLNTCVGKRTYAQFYVLTVCGVLYPACQLASGLFLLASAAARDAGVAAAGAPAFYALSGLNAALSAGLVCGYGSLWTYHTYLCAIGQGTYMQMLESRKRELARSKERRERELQLQQPAKSPPPSETAPAAAAAAESNDNDNDNEAGWASGAVDHSDHADDAEVAQPQTQLSA